VSRALQRRHKVLEDNRIDRWLSDEVHQRSAELRREQENLERLSVATLEALVNALEAKDAYLRGHSARVADLSAGVAAELGLSDEDVEMIRTAGRLHDIGKIGIREDVLNKQGPLTDDEYAHVKQHVLVGSQILAPLVHLRDIISFVRNHHERWDGFGYPDRLKGEAIPLGARVVGAVEIFDALTTARPYQEKMPPETAVERMRDLIDTVVDERIHSALEAVIKRRAALTFLDDSED
jgi:putative two-component system response regulator